jgi:diaminohydroxyphosphoribosylaminopyrimidine deaminase/5-amino-6-(5-phosphoribosylamino)uracil reductase
MPDDKTFTQRALTLAAKGRGRTSPNPMVGAVIVKDNKIIAAGYHKKAGTSHAEVLALGKAGAKAGGATLYVNLEPCCHTEKKTPPCTKAIIKAGIKKVVTAMIDPNSKVSGRGIRELQNAGIETSVGIMHTEAKKLNEAFIKFITKKEPFVILKIAQSLDGKIATAKGESKWITGEDARKYVHKLRNEVDAVLVGAGTVKKDNPSLTCRIKGGRNPFRVIVDSSLSIPLNAKVLKHKDGKTIIAATEKAPLRKINYLRNRGHKVLIISGRAGKINLKSLMKKLATLDILSVMIEGGSRINASAVSSGIVDKIMMFTAYKIIGGTDAVPSFGGKSPSVLSAAKTLRNTSIKTIGNDILIEGYV